MIYYTLRIVLWVFATTGCAFLSYLFWQYDADLIGTILVTIMAAGYVLIGVEWLVKQWGDSR